MAFAFLKGHGTSNDFVVLPDPDGSVHGDLDPAVVRDLCDRRRGIGADGVLRVLRGDVDGGAGWFMDYRNADGSVSEMCGNGIRVFARYLVEAGLVDPREPLSIDTRDGLKDVRFTADARISVDMGRPTFGPEVEIRVDGRTLTATRVDMGNPHAVTFVERLEDAGELASAPTFETSDFPSGVNVEFVRRLGPGQLAMRVYERGVGETYSCGTGACAAAAAAVGSSSELAGSTTRIQVPGGALEVTADDRGHLWLTGPAVIVASGTWGDDATPVAARNSVE